MKRLNFIFLFIIAVCNFSCDSTIDSIYYIYLDGEKGKQVQISYIEKEPTSDPTRNLTINETVTLPYFKQTHFVDFASKKLYRDAFLEVKSSNDSTTRAIIFSDMTNFEDGKCPITAVFYTENAVNDCAYCKDLAKDSVLSYLKKINYPCYIEFKKTDTAKKVFLYTW